MTATKKRSDFHIRDDILRRIDWSTVPSEHIGVGVSHGTVTVSGQVETREERKLVVAIATEATGCHAIVDDLVVAQDPGVSDSELARRIDPVLSELASQCTATIHCGIVTVVGPVDDEAQRHRVFGAVGGVDGVVTVVDETATRPTVTAKQVHDVVKGVLREAASDEGSHLLIQVQGHHVTLGGCVHSTYERRAAQYATEGIAGVTTVINDLKVLD